MISYISDTPLSELTWYKIGGKAKYLLYPKNEKEIKKCLAFIKGLNLPYFILGGGSNVLIGDHDFHGAVICTSGLNNIEVFDDFFIRTGAGVNSTDLAQFAYENELEGAEFLYELPGSIGGAAVMNARAYGTQMSNIVRAAHCIDKDGEIKTFTNKELQYAYKTSILQQEDLILYELELLFERGDQKVIKSKMDYNKNDRENKKQFALPSAGCVFKNLYDLNLPAGKLIEDLGFKGKEIGDAQVYNNHANFIVNKGHAKASDIIMLINEIKTEAKKQKDIELELEVQLLGNFGLESTEKSEEEKTK